MEHEDDVDTNCNWYISNGPRSLSEGTGTVGNQLKKRDYQDYGIGENDSNTEKSPGELKRLIVT